MIDPPPLDSTRQIIAVDRLRLLSIAYYISGGIGAAMVSFLLFHFFLVLGMSFIPPDAWSHGTPTPRPAYTLAPGLPAPATTVAHKSDAPPPWLFRVIAGVIGFIILLGWTLGGLTIYAGHCIRKRKHKILIYTMAGLNCIWIPYGTILGIATILLFQWPEVQAEFKA